jgi:hypothetical protein
MLLTPLMTWTLRIDADKDVNTVKDLKIVKILHPCQQRGAVARVVLT